VLVSPRNGTSDSRCLKLLQEGREKIAWEYNFKSIEMDIPLLKFILSNYSRLFFFISISYYSSSKR
jgi:hypothetical protein